MNLYYTTMGPIKLANESKFVLGDCTESMKAEHWPIYNAPISFDYKIDCRSARSLLRKLRAMKHVYYVNQPHIPRKKKKMLKRKICKLIGCKKVIFRYH